MFPQLGKSTGDPSGNAVDLILKWVDVPEMREVALKGSIPRSLNRDILTLRIGNESAPAAFDWLIERPFVEDRGELASDASPAHAHSTMSGPGGVPLKLLPSISARRSTRNTFFRTTRRSTMSIKVVALGTRACSRSSSVALI